VKKMENIEAKDLYPSMEGPKPEVEILRQESEKGVFGNGGA
jgi:hypothetical protein